MHVTLVVASFKISFGAIYSSKLESLDVMESGAAARPGIETNFLHVACTHSQYGSWWAVLQEAHEEEDGEAGDVSRCSLYTESIFLIGQNWRPRHYLVKDIINPYPLNGPGFYLKEASIRGNPVYVHCSIKLYVQVVQLTILLL